MANLSSPGVSVTVIDESFYTPAAPGTVPLIIVATAENKANASGTGIAPGTLKANSGTAYLITSQKDLIDTFGNPVFKTDASNNPVHAGEQNEYGLQTAYSLLGVSNRAYVVRADINLNALNASATPPTNDPANGTHWLDTDNSSWGVFEWNGAARSVAGGQTFTKKTPIVITDITKVDGYTTTGDDESPSPKSSIGSIGDYAVVKDSYKGKEVSYYIEKSYEKVARKIYGNTPQMIAFFESKLGVAYPWSKYAQISGRDFVSGAMENTTATLHSDAVQQDARELVDGNNWESTIAHELFHQWFGDLVTAESWSNITVNESFADYSQTLWFEHSQGKDAGAFENYTGLRNYLSSPSDAEKNLVRFFYQNKEDVFDLVSYQKGGRILNMLRHLVGDDAFFASLNKYLTDNKFSNGSAIKLKLAFEAVTGKDLNWFFNQWYFSNGHPYVRIGQKYMADQQKVLVTIQQTQTQNKLFTLPVGIDVYVNGNRNHYEVWSKNKVDSFYFPAAVAPDNVNVDNDKILLWAKDESKPIEQYAYQFKYARNFMDRFEAANEATTNLKNPTAKAIIEAAIKDSFYVIRSIALNSYNPSAIDATMEAQILELAGKDKVSTVREDAINVLSKINKPSFTPLYEKWLHDSSYTVSGAALAALEIVDSTKAIVIAKAFSKEPLKKRLNTVVTTILTKYGDAEVFDFVAATYAKLNIQSSEKFEMTMPFAQLLIKTTDPVKFKKGIDLIVEFREAIPQGYRVQTDPYFNFKILGDIIKAKKQKGETELLNIASAVLPKI